MLDLTVAASSAALPAVRRRDGLRVLGLVSPSFDADVRRILRDMAVDVDFASDPREFVDRVAAGVPSFALVDIDVPGVHAELLRAMRIAAQGLLVLGMTYYWSDGEVWARDVTDGLVHKPPRSAEWTAQLRRMGLILPPAA